MHRIEWHYKKRLHHIVTLLTGSQCRLPVQAQPSGLTGVGRKQGATLAVDDLLDERHFLRDGRRHHTEAGHHGIEGCDSSSHHAEVRIEIWRRERDASEIAVSGRPCESSTVSNVFPPEANLWLQLMVSYCIKRFFSDTQTALPTMDNTAIHE